MIKYFKFHFSMETKIFSSSRFYLIFKQQKISCCLNVVCRQRENEKKETEILLNNLIGVRSKSLFPEETSLKILKWNVIMRRFSHYSG